MKVLGDMMFPGGKYQSSGEEKTRWIRCGVLMQAEDGAYRIKIDSMPIGIPPDGGWFQVFPKRDFSNKEAPKTGERGDDMPW